MKTSRRSRVQPSRVLIVDDHPMMRLGLRQFLTQERDLTVCGETASAAETMAAVERTKPDIVLVDISLEGPSGLELLRELHTHYPRLPVLMHSMHDEFIYAERCIQAGARGYLMKQETGQKLADAVRQVLRGEIYLSDALRAAARSSSRRKEPRPAKTPIARLTPREFEVFRLIGAGCVNRQIADQLHISIKTVEAHREHIKRKLNLSTSTALNLLAVRWETEQRG